MGNMRNNRVHEGRVDTIQASYSLFPQLVLSIGYVCDLFSLYFVLLKYSNKNQVPICFKIRQERAFSPFLTPPPFIDPHRTFFPLASSSSERSLQWVPTLLPIIIHLP